MLLSKPNINGDRRSNNRRATTNAATRAAKTTDAEPRSTPSRPNNANHESQPNKDIDLATHLFNLARTGATSHLQTYISAGIPVDMSDTSGDTLLTVAAFHGHAMTVSMPLSKGADPNVVNDSGHTIITGAIYMGHTVVAKVLRKGGADIHKGRPTAIDCCLMFNRISLLLFLTYGRDPPDSALSNKP